MLESIITLSLILESIFSYVGKYCHLYWKVLSVILESIVSYIVSYIGKYCHLYWKVLSVILESIVSYVGMYWYVRTRKLSAC